MHFPIARERQFQCFYTVLFWFSLGFDIMLWVLVENKQSESDSLENKMHETDLVLLPRLSYKKFPEANQYFKSWSETYIHLWDEKNRFWSK